MCFMLHSLELAILDDLNQISLFNLETAKIVGITRFPISDPIHNMWANNFDG